MVFFGGTGSGKTTLTPLALACAGYTVHVAMPGRGAMVRSAVQTLKTWRMDKEVGQQLRGESRWLRSRVGFATCGALLHQLLADGTVHSETVILDEFHCIGDSSDLQVLVAALLFKLASQRQLIVLTVQGSLKIRLCMPVGESFATRKSILASKKDRNRLVRAHFVLALVMGSVEGRFLTLLREITARLANVSTGFALRTPFVEPLPASAPVLLHPIRIIRTLASEVVKMAQ